MLRQKLAAGVPVIGTWNTLASPLVTEVIARAGFDFQIVDLEHGPFVLDEIHLHVSACTVETECAPLVRVPSNQPWMILQALDQGARGVVVPHTSNSGTADDLVKAIRYYPEGERGFTPFSKAGGFTNKDVAAHVQNSNENIVGIAIVESVEGLTSAVDIAKIDGIDVVYFGAYDLSQDLGHPGEPKHPEVVEAIKEAVGKVRSVGCSAGGFVPQSADEIAWLLELDMNFVTYEVDSSILYRHANEICTWFSEEVEN